MYSFGETDLPVWPTCVEYGYQPASTTARVAPTAPPSAEASSSRSVKPSGEPSPRPPATMMSASSIDGPLDASTVCSDERGDASRSRRTPSRSSRPRPSPPDSTGSSAPARTIPSLGSSFQPTSTMTVSPSAGRVPTSSPSATDRSVRSQLSPAPRRAASPEATSAERTEAPKRTASAPISATSVASASTRGCGQRCHELRRVARVHLGGAVGTRAGSDCGSVLAEHDADGVTERRGLREHPEPALLERAVRSARGTRGTS